MATSDDFFIGEDVIIMWEEGEYQDGSIESIWGDKFLVKLDGSSVEVLMEKERLKKKNVESKFFGN